jgi:probable rRNA maturation factor
MRAKTSSLTIINCQRALPVAVARLESFFECVRSEMRFPKGSVSVRLISDPAMARLNASFRGKRGPTDVLSFPATSHARRRTSPSKRGRARVESLLDDDLNDDLNAAETYIGDIAISPQTAARNARAGSRALQVELRVLILHGMIHLAGYDHETDHGEMTRLEMRLRRRLKLIPNEKRPSMTAAYTRTKSSRAQTKSTQSRPTRTQVRLQR